MKFKALHQQDDPLLIGNVWDVASASVAEKVGFSAIGTPSAAVAAQRGYPDGERVPFAEVMNLAEQITSTCSLPLTVDLEGGYSRKPEQIADNIKRLADLGAVGINIEDSVPGENRKLLSPNLFANTLNSIKSELARSNIDIFLNVRTDTFLLGCSPVLPETQRRIQLYEKSGADGIFVPGIEQEGNIRTVVQCTKLPVNVMATPTLPDFPTLKSLGVKRISMGNLLFDDMHHHLDRTFRAILDHQSFKLVFDDANRRT